MWQYLLFFIIILVSWLTGRLVDRVIYNQVLAFIEKRNFSLDPSKLLPLQTIVWLVISLLVHGWIT